MVPLEENRDLVDDLGLVALALEGLELDSAHPEVAELGMIRDRLVRSIRSYLIPRIGGAEVPLTVVFAGPTGSGKSTLVNSLSGLDISETGPLRPTTTGPVVLASERHAPDFDQISGVRCDVVVGAAPILSEVALVDTPDIDSTSVRNRATAEVLIDNADIVVFVTSVSRYSDLVPWEVLRRALSRGVPVINVLNRITATSAAAITDFKALLGMQGMGADIVRVPEHHVAAGAHRVPSIAIRALQRRLVELVSDIDFTRRGVTERVLRSTAGEVMALAARIETVSRGHDDARTRARSLFGSAVGGLDLDPMFAGSLPIPPEGLLARLGWRWRSRVSRQRWEEIADRATRRLVSLVEGDLRRLAATQNLHLPGDVVAHAREMTAAAAEGWLDELRQISLPSGASGRGLVALALADATVRGESTAAFDLLLADPSLLTRMREALEERIESVYGGASALLTDHPDDLSFDGDDAERLRIAASSLNVRSQFADA